MYLSWFFWLKHDFLAKACCKVVIRSAKKPEAIYFHSDSYYILSTTDTYVFNDNFVIFIAVKT